MDWVYHYMEYFESSNMKSPTCIHGRLKTSMHEGTKLAQCEIQALSNPLIRSLDGILQNKWDPIIPSSDSLLLMELNYESMQND